MTAVRNAQIGPMTLAQFACCTMGAEKTADGVQEGQEGPCQSAPDMIKQASTCRKVLQDLRQNLQADQSILNRLIAEIFNEVSSNYKCATSLQAANNPSQSILQACDPIPICSPLYAVAQKDRATKAAGA